MFQTPAIFIPGADIVILAVPDVALEKVSSEIIPAMKEGALVVTLDPAAALAGKLHQKRRHLIFYNTSVSPFNLQLGT